MLKISVSGVRGIIGTDIGPSDFVSLTRAFSRYLGKGAYIVAHDTRSSNEMVYNAVISALSAEGCEVYGLGLAPTPSVFRMVRQKSFKGGIIVTASHNPPEWNGLKFVLDEGRSMYSNELNHFIKEYSRRKSNMVISTNEIRHIDYSSYLSDLISFVGKDSCKGVRVGIDSGGGVGSIFASELFRSLGCNVVSINDSPGIFPRGLDPSTSDLDSLSQIVIDKRCDIGFAYDCDADRVILVNDQGKILAPDMAFLLCVNSFLKKGFVGKVAASIDTSTAINEIASLYGTEVIHSPVGEANVVEKILGEKCAIGGEGSSGGVIIPNFVLCRDGILSSSLILKSIKEEGSLERIIKEIPIHSQVRTKIHCSKENSLRIIGEFITKYPESDLTDGVKITIGEKASILIRYSATEDVIRISVEAENQEKSERLARKYMSEIKRILSQY